MNKSIAILTIFLVSVSALRVHQQGLPSNRGNSTVPNNYIPNTNQGGYTQPGNNNQGGYTQPGNNNQGGYKQPGYNNQGGYTQPGNNNQGGYTQPGYNNQGGYTQPGYNNQQNFGKCDSSRPGYIDSKIPGPYNRQHINQPIPQRNANGQVSLNGVLFIFQNPFKLICYNRDGSIYRYNSCFDVFNCAEMFKDYTQCQGKIVKENVQFDCS